MSYDSSIPENLEELPWPKLQQLGAEHGVRGKKETILATLRRKMAGGSRHDEPEAAPVEEAQAPEPPPEEPAPGLHSESLGISVGDIVSYRDKVNGLHFDARVSLIVDEKNKLLNLHVFSGAGGSRRRLSVPRGKAGGEWWPKS